MGLRVILRRAMLSLLIIAMSSLMRGWVWAIVSSRGRRKSLRMRRRRLTVGFSNFRRGWRYQRGVLVGVELCISLGLIKKLLFALFGLPA